jgi:hypothetical protein
MRAAMSYPINYSSNCPRDCRQLNRCSQQANVDNAVIIIGHVGDGQNREIHIITVQVLKDICVWEISYRFLQCWPDFIDSSFSVWILDVMMLRIPALLKG